MRKKSAFIAVLAVTVLALAPGSANAAPPDQPQPLPEEAPKALFSSKVGDDDVELFLQGFWEASVLSSASFSVGPSGSLFNPVPLLFMQRPDLYLLLTFRKAWWLEASVAEDATRSTFALGYTGDENDVIKAARLGNAGISVADYPYLNFGAPAGAFGAMVHAAKGDASFDAIARWDGLAWRARRFFGLAETVENELSPEAHIRGRRFALPHAGVDSLRLYDVVDGAPRHLAADEYSASLALGTLSLNAAPRGVLYAYYRASSLDLGGAAPDSTVDGYPVLKLYEAGLDYTVNVYESRNLYALADSAQARELFVRSAASGQPDLTYEVRQVGPGLIEALVAGTVDPRADDYKYPFLSVAPWVYDEPPADGVKPAYPVSSGLAVVARSVIALDSLSIERDAVAGTVTVERDGAPSAAFDYDAGSGELKLFPPPRAGEDIVVRYAVSSQDRSDGALVFGAGTRFPWVGLDWEIALGGRWPLPGAGFAEGGELKPAWAGIAAAASYESLAVRAKADAFFRYSRASASGVYRAAGMEDGSVALSPFRPDAATTVASVLTATAILDTSLAAAFPDELASVHGTGEDNFVLRIVAETGASLENGGLGADGSFVRYVEAVPLSSFGTMEFFVRFTPSAGANPTTLDLAIDDGTGQGVSLAAIPLDGLAGWNKLTLRLDPALASWTLVNSAGANMGSGAGAFNPGATASRIVIGVDGMDDGETVQVDELVLRDPAQGVALIGSASLGLGEKDDQSGSFLDIEARGQLSSSPSIAGSAAAAWTLGPSAWYLNVSPSWADGQPGFGAGYGLYVPSRDSANRIYDEYSRDAGLGRYARKLGAGLSVLNGTLGASASASSTEQGGRFAQAWDASLGLGSLASLKADMKLAAPGTVLGNSDFGAAWLASWGLLAPTAESQASARGLSVSASLFGGILSLSAANDYTSSGGTARKLSARLSAPLEAGPVRLNPYYERATSEQRPSSDSGFVDDAASLLDAIVRSYPLWASVPLVELFDPAHADSWSGFATGATGASHAAGAGVSISRSIGYGLVDLYVPNSMEASFKRTLASAGDILTDSSTLSLRLAGGAANIFARNGVKPLLAAVEFDEYSSALDFRLTRYHSDGIVTPAFALKYGASLEGGAGWSLSGSNRFGWESTRASTGWSDALYLGLSTRPGRTWLGSLASMALSPRKAPAARDGGSAAETDAAASAQPPGTEVPPPGSVASWLSEVLSRTPVLRETWSVSAKAGKSAEVDSALSLEIGASYETRLIQAGSLSFGFRAAITQAVSVLEAGTTYGGSLELGIDGKVTF